jgi:hypothetical protein
MLNRTGWNMFTTQIVSRSHKKYLYFLASIGLYTLAQYNFKLEEKLEDIQNE